MIGLHWLKNILMQGPVSNPVAGSVHACWTSDSYCNPLSAETMQPSLGLIILALREAGIQLTGSRWKP